LRQETKFVEIYLNLRTRYITVRGKMKKQSAPQAFRNIEPSFFQTPTFQALTIGVPFCIFKMLFGLLSIRVGAQQSSFLVSFGWLVIAWASVDLAMNLARVFFHLYGRESPLEYCTLAQAGRIFGRPRLFLAIDTFLSFSIICFVLWSGWIKNLTTIESYAWYAATTLNLISISLVSIWLELGRGS
jgi:hypothetical protein